VSRVWLLDGRSGSGKTVLAHALADELGAAVVHMDDLYPGWEGLDAGSAYALERILVPLARGDDAVWRRWDWEADARAEEHRLPAGSALVLEGCGALSRASAPLAERAIWLECDEPTRRSRALARDGVDDWWEGWRAQEDAFYARERSCELATEVRGCG
jgi:cytidylate kinase